MGLEKEMELSMQTQTQTETLQTQTLQTDSPPSKVAGVWWRCPVCCSSSRDSSEKIGYMSRVQHDQSMSNVKT